MEINATEFRVELVEHAVIADAQFKFRAALQALVRERLQSRAHFIHFALHDGANELVVEVVGTWHNRLVGEARGAVPRWTKTNVTQSQRGVGQDLQSGAWKSLDPIDAGLFGPVRLIPMAVQLVE